jgi:hypothetical protein
VTFVLLFALFIVLVVVVAVLGARAAKKRQQAFAAWAAAHGYRYEKQDDRFADLPWGPPFGVGFGRAAFDVLSYDGPDRPVLCFTYRYKTESSNGKTTTTESHYFAIYSARLQKPLPGLRVSKEGFFGTIARAVGFHDIEFESEQFNKAFKVKGDDRKFAFDVINPQMMQFLLDTDAPGFAIVGSDIILVRHGRMALESVEPTMGYLETVIGHIPEFVWEGD